MVDQLGPLGAHGDDEALELIDEGIDERKQPQAESGRIGVIRRLGLVDVVVGIDDVIAALGISQVLQCKVGDHLIGIHVDAGTRSSLKLIDRELIQASFGNQHLIARPYDGARNFRIQGPKITVC